MANIKTNFKFCMERQPYNKIVKKLNFTIDSGVNSNVIIVILIKIKLMPLKNGEGEIT